MITALLTVKSVRWGTPTARLESAWQPQCATNVCVIRADFDLDSLITADLGLAPHLFVISRPYSTNFYEI